MAGLAARMTTPLPSGEAPPPALGDIPPPVTELSADRLRTTGPPSESADTTSGIPGAPSFPGIADLKIPVKDLMSSEKVERRDLEGGE